MTVPAGPQQAFDRRLLRLGGAVRVFLGAAVALGAVAAAATVVQAILLALVLSRAFDGAGIADATPALIGIVGTAALQGILAWSTDVIAHHSAGSVRSSLRRALVRKVVARRGAGVDAGSAAAAAGPGLEALDPYFARFLPQAALAGIVPVTLVAVIAVLDPWSAVIVVVTLPLIPLFASLIGAATRSRVRRRWDAFTALSSAFLEAVRSLPTLKVFGRSGTAVEDFGRLAARHRTETMGTLRIAFLSALALELAATISVAVVAVAVGLRVLNAGLELRAALTVLILAPEAYLPLRRLAASFHDAVQGIEAAGRVLDEIERPVEARARGARPAPHRPAIRFRDVGVIHPDRSEPALDGISLEIRAGDYVALVGPTGSGKSTLLDLILGFTEPSTGSVTIDGADLRDHNAGEWLERIAWMPQAPHLFAGSIADNVRFGAPGSSEDEVVTALHAAGAGFVDGLPEGIRTPLAEGGTGLSAGERTRIALARALLRRADVLLLDEPTANVDPITELRILDTLESLAGRCTIVVATHRVALAARAHRRIGLERGRLLGREPS